MRVEVVRPVNCVMALWDRIARAIYGITIGFIGDWSNVRSELCNVKRPGGFYEYDSTVSEFTWKHLFKVYKHYEI